MIRYVPTSGQSVAQDLTEKLWCISRPDDVREALDTVEMFMVVTALDGSAWLVVDTDYTVPVHPAAELDGIADILQPWIDASLLPSDTIAVLAAFVESQRGGTMNVWAAFPQLFKDQSKTREELIASNLLMNLP